MSEFPYALLLYTLSVLLLGAALGLRAGMRKQRKRALGVEVCRLPESNGKHNYTAFLYRKQDDDGKFGIMFSGIAIARSEYPGRVQYEADEMRYLIGELDARPNIMDYDSDYLDPDTTVDEGVVI